MSDLRDQILARLDGRLDDHAADCVPAMCVHSGDVVVRAVVDLHAPGTKPGSEETCAGCAVPGVAFVWLDRCRTLAAIAAALGVGVSR